MYMLWSLKNNFMISVTIKISIVILFLFLSIPESFAKKGCKWKTSNHIDCTSSWAGLGTGCLGLKNISSHKINFRAYGERVLKKGQSKKADFKPGLSITNCDKWVEKKKKWEYVTCKKVLKIIKNKNSGGGCGCKHFTCLPKA